MSEISALPAVRIKDALYGLVRDKSYKEITVVDISRIAHVNRKTFYNHYEDKESCG